MISTPIFAEIKNDMSASDKKMLEIALQIADRQSEINAIHTIRALGWEQEFENVDTDLKKFQTHHINFIPLFARDVLLSRGRELFEANQVEKVSHDQDDFSFYLKVESMMGIMQQYPLLWFIAPATAAVSLSIPVIPVGALGARELASWYIWGSKIEFRNHVSPTDLKNITGYVYCKSQKHGDFWLKDAEYKEIVGTWGYDEKRKNGFATQVDYLTLLIQCAEEIRLKKPSVKIQPNEIEPTIGVSLAGTKTLYSYYPISYYTQFLDNEDKAIKISTYFTEK
jgi:hypothetical protein